ncbi:MAG: hypothetical protein D3910_10610, partial [Candidatus Electrothrix sp. ATG2]|nr:hypothetical protein [Candidatus Electrothrix sp. ATG2]
GLQTIKKLQMEDDRLKFVVILVAALIINFSKRRQRKSPHGLTGMCHRSGGVVCGSCGEGMHKEDSINS